MTVMYSVYSFSSSSSSFFVCLSSGYSFWGSPKSSSPAMYVSHLRSLSSYRRWYFLRRSMASCGRIPFTMGPFESKSSRKCSTSCAKRSTCETRSRLKPPWRRDIWSFWSFAKFRSLRHLNRMSATLSNSSLATLTSYFSNRRYMFSTGPNLSSISDSRSRMSLRASIRTRKSARLSVTSEWSSFSFSSISKMMRSKSDCACWCKFFAYWNFHSSASRLRAFFRGLVFKQSEPIV
mmetsp:Transcript_3401/g.5808  ORF Transcript_3401/g.5808 Transcript_3401/m.5808 type:complete len:235 (+) Transcript_3401:9852-10556(+)